MKEEDWDADRYLLEVAQVQNILDSWTPDKFSMPAIRRLIAHFPPKLRTATFTALQSGYRAHQIKKYEMELKSVRAEAQGKMANEKAIREWKREGRAFWTGVALLLLALAVSLMVPNISQITSLLLRTTAGLGVALIIAFLPGLFSVDTSIKLGWGKVAFRATGGLAGFVMIYMFDPGWISSLTKILK
jgi:hypothetical protein